MISNDIKISRSTAIVLSIAMAVYLGFALSGLHYGLPHGGRSLSYDADETTWLESLSRIKPGHLNPAPELVTPTFYLELYGAAILVAKATGYIPHAPNKEWYRLHLGAFARFYLVGRYLQVLCGVLLLIAVAGTVQAVYGTIVANVAVLLLVVTPSLVATSHFSQASLPVALLGFLSLGCLLIDDRYKPIHRRWLLAAGFFGGLAVSTKYSAIPLALPLVYQGWRRGEWKAIGPIALSATLGLFIGTPFAFLDPHSFWEGFKVISKANLMPVSGAAAKLLFPFRYPLRYAMGDVLEAACIAAVAWHILRRDSRNILLLLWIIGFFAGVLAAGTNASSARVLILIPALLILLAQPLAQGMKHRGFLQAGAYGALLFLLGSTLRPSLAILALRHTQPIQMTSSNWIESNIPQGTRIGIPLDAYWSTPDIVFVSAYHPERLAHPYRIEVLHFSREMAERLKPDYILLSANERNSCPISPEASTCPDFLNWLDSGRDYKLVKTFPRVVQWRGWRWNRPEIPMVFDDDVWASSLMLYRRK